MTAHPKRTSRNTSMLIGDAHWQLTPGSAAGRFLPIRCNPLVKRPSALPSNRPGGSAPSVRGLLSVAGRASLVSWRPLSRDVMSARGRCEGHAAFVDECFYPSLVKADERIPRQSTGRNHCSGVCPKIPPKKLRVEALELPRSPRMWRETNGHFAPCCKHWPHPRILSPGYGTPPSISLKP